MDKYEDVVNWESKALEASSQREYDEAIHAHIRALKIANELCRPRLMAVLYNRLGNALEAKAQIQKAVNAFESGVKSLAGDPNVNLGSVIDSLRSVAKAYDPGYNYLEVPDLYSETTAEELNEAENDPVLSVKLLINIGNAYLRQPEMDPAMNAYQKALLRPEILEAPVLRAHALTHVGIIQRRRGDVKQAQKSLQEALELFETHGESLEKRRALAALAGIYREQEENALALKTYQKALELYREVDDPLGEGRALANIGHLYLLRQQFENARMVFQRAIGLATQVQDEDTLWHAHWGWGRCLHIAGELEKAVEAFQNCLGRIKQRHRELRTDEGKVTFLESVQDIFNHLIAVHLDLAQSDPNAYRDVLKVAEEARGQALYDLMGSRRRQFWSRQTDVRRTRLLPFSQRARNMTSDSFNPAVQMAPGVSSASGSLGPMDDPVWDEDKDVLTDWLESAPAVPSTVPRWPMEDHDRDTAAVTPEPMAHLVFHVLSDRTAVIVVTPEGTVHGHVATLGQEALTERVTAIRKALNVDNAPRSMEIIRDARRSQASETQSNCESLLRSLYEELIRPVVDFLPDDGTPVVIEPHKALWLLPFAALQGTDGKWFADRCPILYSPSAQVLEEIRKERDYGSSRDLKPLIVGNPSMPTIPEQEGMTTILKPLPGAELESRDIYSLFARSDGTLLKNIDADWASVITMMPRHGIIHLATHGIAYAENPLNSFVALGEAKESVLENLTGHRSSNSPKEKFLTEFGPSQGRHGMLTARQILYLPLPADLVTLSACQTGLGQISGDGIIGLCRSFLVAGARSVLVSLWSISDKATSELMVAFYRYYIQIDDKAIALQKAMQELRSKPEYDHPRYWAPFVLVGAEV